jgi:hypothetical protein
LSLRNSIPASTAPPSALGPSWVDDIDHLGDAGFRTSASFRRRTCTAAAGRSCSAASASLVERIGGPSRSIAHERDNPQG